MNRSACVAICRLSAVVCVAVLPALLGPALAQQAEPLAALRAAALAAVNRDRGAHGLPPLRPSEALNAAAQAHAADMFRRRYFSHDSPEGHTVGDRYQAQGGSQWQLVEENIATCSGCPTPPTDLRVVDFEQGWMESPHHRENILRHGITSFGFGIAGGHDRAYGVQTFAGPGTPRNVSSAEPAEALTATEQARAAIRQINAARRVANVPPLRVDRGLNTVARQLVSNNPGQIIDQARMNAFSALTDEGGAWRKLRLQASRCGGCGVRPTAPDVASLVMDMEQGGARNDLLAADFDSAGFAMSADGMGMKSAVLLVGRRR